MWGHNSTHDMWFVKQQNVTNIGMLSYNFFFVLQTHEDKYKENKIERINMFLKIIHINDSEFTKLPGRKYLSRLF